MLRTAEPNDYAAEILFFVAKPNPSTGFIEGVTGYVFALGEVQIKLSPADLVWINVPISGPLSQVVERGHGWYAIRLTPAQRAAATTVVYQFVSISDPGNTQPDRGTETIGDLSGDIPEGGTGLVIFFLADQTNPVYGAPLVGHVFTSGEVEISLPNDAFALVAPADIVECGGGVYGAICTGVRRGKVIVYANVTGAQPSSGYKMILGNGSGTGIVVPSLPGASSSGTGDAIFGDLALFWDNALGSADFRLTATNADLEADQGLATSMLLSLFLDARAADDDVPPSGDPNDRRGWWADEFFEAPIGSRLWLLARAKASNETLLQAKEYVKEATAWYVTDRVASSVGVTAVYDAAKRLLLTVGVQRPGKDPTFFRFSHVWDHMQESA